MRALLAHHIRRTTVVFCLCLTFLIGVRLAHTGWLIDGSWVLLAGGFMLFSLRKRSWWTLTWVVLFGLSLGWWRGTVYMQKLADYESLYGRKITITAHVTDDAVYDKYKQLAFDVNDVVVQETGQHLTGKVGLSGFGFPAAYQGDVVVATGKLRPGLGSYQAKMSYATITVTERHTSVVGNIRRHFAAGMQSALPEPLASFGMGLLIGQRNTLPADVSQVLLMVGLTHIIAVSGYNLTILLRASRNILGKRSKHQALLLALALIGLFLLLTGSSASIVRAAIVSTLSIMTAYYGRSVKPLVLITVAAAITAFANPFYVWTDTSWYLSFLAFFGVMVLAPMIQVRFPNRLKSSLVMGVALESLCAEIMTLPFILHVFGQMSFVGLIANVLIAVLVPFAMLLATVAGLAGMLVPAVAGWFAWPARLLLTYMLDAAGLLSRVPHAFVENIGIATWQFIGLYIVAAGVCVMLWHKTKHLKTVTITDRNQLLEEGA